MAMSLEESKKLVRIDKHSHNTVYLVKKIVKIGPLDPKIALLSLKKIKRKKLQEVKYIAWLASWLSGVKTGISD